VFTAVDVAIAIVFIVEKRLVFEAAASAKLVDWSFLTADSSAAARILVFCSPRMLPNQQSEATLGQCFVLVVPRACMQAPAA
jgi:hypothetical protein